jgi:DnaJ like chaperone protein
VQLRGKLGLGIGCLVLFDLIGIPFGGLIGFAAGSFIGHFFIDLPRERESNEALRAFRRRQGQFLYHTMALCAKVAKADGPINQHEIAHMDRVMRQQFRLADQDRVHFTKVWKDTKESDEAFETFARTFYRDFGRERHQVLNMLDLLFAVAAADGNLNRHEESLILRAAGVFHISRLQYDRLKSRYFGPTQPPPRDSSRQQQQRWEQSAWSPLDPYYAILGAQPQESLEVIKQKFRALVMKWHPDKMAGQGASTAALRHAKEKFQQINDAYERIVEARKKR